MVVHIQTYVAIILLWNSFNVKHLTARINFIIYAKPTTYIKKKQRKEQDKIEKEIMVLIWMLLLGCDVDTGESRPGKTLNLIRLLKAVGNVGHGFVNG